MTGVVHLKSTLKSPTIKISVGVGVRINHSLNLTKGIKIVTKRRNITHIWHINIKKEIGFSTVGVDSNST